MDDHENEQATVQPEPAPEFAGQPDGFERLWVPHRIAYVRGENRPSDDDGVKACPFCVIPTKADDEGLVVARGHNVYVVMNLYPYNAGHVLVVPYRHVARYVDTSDDEAAEMTAMTKKMIRVFGAVSSPEGFNIGMNQGSIAGAGIAEHLHQHIVPRWGGDANFLPIIARTKALPELLSDTRERLAQAWQAMA